MKSIFSLILIFLMILPNCGMVFAGNMDEMMSTNNEIMVMSEMMNLDRPTSSDTSLQNGFYNCCAEAIHNGILARDTHLTNSAKDIVSVIRIGTLIFGEESILKSKTNAGIHYRPHAPPDPQEYISLIGTSVKNLN